MKTFQQKKREGSMKLDRQVWKACGIEKAVRKFGFDAVKHALNKWTEYQRTNKKLLREKHELEQKLADIDSKL